MLVYYSIVSLIFMVAFSDNNMEKRIVGGTGASIIKFPHSALLYVTDKIQFICSTSVLNEYILLTAAHCVKGHGKPKTRMEIFAGYENYLKSNIKRNVDSFIPHGAFNPDAVIGNDIALIFIAKKPLPLGNTIKRVIIRSKFPRTASAFVAGWGLVNDFKSETTENLRMAKQTIMDARTCSKYVPASNGVFCAGDIDSRKARPSQGDSGSALMAGYQQIGLVSFTYPYIRGIIFYTNVSHYYPWIRKTVNNRCSIKD